MTMQFISLFKKRSSRCTCAVGLNKSALLDRTPWLESLHSRVSLHEELLNYVVVQRKPVLSGVLFLNTKFATRWTHNKCSRSWICIALTRKSSVFTCARLLKVIIKTSAAPVTFDLNSPQEPPTIHLHHTFTLSLWVTYLTQEHNNYVWTSYFKQNYHFCLVNNQN